MFIFVLIIHVTNNSTMLISLSPSFFVSLYKINTQPLFVVVFAVDPDIAVAAAVAAAAQ